MNSCNWLSDRNSVLPLDYELETKSLLFYSISSYVHVNVHYR